MQNLGQKTIRGGFAKVCSQATSFAVRIGSLWALGHLLDPKDFGLVGMVTAIVGVLGLFKDFGLSTATVQQKVITQEQLSTLFWLNILVGTVLALLSVAAAPLISSFYHEPRLARVTIVSALGFIFNAAGVQHSAVLQRQMRFTAISVIEILSLVFSTAIGIGMALKGFGYWALVGITITSPLVSTVGMWVSAAWLPGMPRRNVGIRSMMRFGGTTTLIGLVVYIAYNLDKVLLGRFAGTEAVGIYGRAYQFVNIPTDNLSSAVGGVAFSALSRVQDDPGRLRSYFLKGYSLVLALTLPITMVCALFANDLISVVLGPKWTEAVPIFRLLAPTILIFAMINPLGWLLYSIGLVERSLKVALAMAPLVICGYLLGLPYGPVGVAFAFSAAMTLWVVPHIAWCVHGTMISLRDIATAVGRPLLSSIVATIVAFGGQLLYGSVLPPLARLVLGTALLTGTYLGMLLFVMGQKAFYIELVARLKGRPSNDEKALVSV